MARMRNTEKRVEILNVAFELYMDKGYENVKFSEIAKQCGMSVQLLQHYFHKEQDILVELNYNILMRTFLFLSRHSSMYDSVPDEDAPIVPLVVYYRLMSTVFTRNVKLFSLCREDMYDIRLLNNTVDHLCVGLRENLGERFVGGYEWENALHVAAASQASLFVRFTSDISLTFPAEVIVEGTIRALCGYLEMGPDQCSRILETAKELVTRDFEDEYLAYFEETYRDFKLIS